MSIEAASTNIAGAAANMAVALHQALVDAGFRSVVTDTAALLSILPDSIRSIRMRIILTIKYQVLMSSVIAVVHNLSIGFCADDILLVEKP